MRVGCFMPGMLDLACCSHKALCYDLDFEMAAPRQRPLGLSGSPPVPRERHRAPPRESAVRLGRKRSNLSTPKRLGCAPRKPPRGVGLVFDEGAYRARGARTR
jgi:hypothetical protein